jgi:hypothetical protein
VRRKITCRTKSNLLDDEFIDVVRSSPVTIN